MTEALLSIENETDYRFYYKEEWLTPYTVNATFENAELETVLNALFKETELNYIIRDKSIILTKNAIVYQNLPQNYFDTDSSNVDVSGQNAIIKTQSQPTSQVISIGKQQRGDSKTHILSGIVRDAVSGEPLASLAITTTDRSHYTTTLTDGSYKLELPSGYNSLETNLLGYQQQSYTIVLYGDGTLDMKLEENTEMLGEVLIDAERDKNISEAVMGLTSINIESIKTIPLVLGERDILKAAITLPGISTAGEGANGYNVRGGRTDQNLILLDDAVLYAPNHFLGFFSAVNPFTTAKADIYKASIPAEFGGRLSSVIDIETKDGNTSDFSGEGSIGPVTANIALEIPVVKEKAAIIAGVRATYADWILNSLDEESLNNSEASFYDAIVKYHHKIGEKNTISATGYYSRDRFSITTDSLYDYENSLASIKWETRLNDKTNADFHLNTTHYTYDINFDGDTNADFDYGYAVNETQLKANINHNLNEKHKLQYGLSSKIYGIQPGNISPRGTNSDVLPLRLAYERGLESAVFFSDSYKPNKNWLFDLGFRLSMFNALGSSTQNFYADDEPKNDGSIVRTESYDDFQVYETYFTPEFRLSGRYFLTESASLKASFNRSAQYIHQLTSNTTVSPTDIWKLSDSNIKPQRGNQYALGIYKNVDTRDLEISLEGYYKTMDNILDYKVGADLTLNQTIEQELLQGTGRAYGVELLIKKEKGDFNGYFGYTYSRSELRLNSTIPEENVNNGQYFPANYDKPHDFSLVSNYRLTRRFSFSSNFVYQTGRPVTYPTGKFIYAGQEQVVYSDRNRFRIPDYYRLDLGINIEGNHKKNKLAHSFVNISVYNVLGRNNPYSVFFVTEDNEIKAFQTSIFSIPIPTITYNFKF
ncbi:carboxypeptidase-like regulatory domain-containing protein [Flavimarina sp. Hel_I_48]|uniref:TonB-dependent receptor n=1 Tax=Flavimarina sp. Hel_I_48 TaxID=1392488 RepID=UPI000AA8C31D|nr:carboxypeptidase-like regulatory domain-containing protein [Flavimarina sp. Hel_I_48]